MIVCMVQQWSVWQNPDQVRTNQKSWIYPRTNHCHCDNINYHQTHTWMCAANNKYTSFDKKFKKIDQKYLHDVINDWSCID